MKTLKSAIAALEKAKTLHGKAQAQVVEAVVRKLIRALANRRQGGVGGGGEDDLLP